MAASVGIRLTRATVAYGAVYRDIHCVTPLRAGSRPDAVIPAISALVLVLLTADGPILVRAALWTRHGRAIEAFDFSGAMLVPYTWRLGSAYPSNPRPFLYMGDEPPHLFSGHTVLPEPDFHRLDRAIFVWRTRTTLILIC